MKEDFSDFNKVDKLVKNWEEKGIGDEEQQKGAGDFTNNSSREEQENSDVKDSVFQSQEQMDLGYTYNYDNLSEYESYPIGTPALLEFADGYYEGKISDFTLSDDKKNATYTITWSDDTADVFVNELEWMDLIVANAEAYKPWEIGA